MVCSPAWTCCCSCESDRLEVRQATKGPNGRVQRATEKTGRGAIGERHSRHDNKYGSTSRNAASTLNNVLPVPFLKGEQILTADHLRPIIDLDRYK